MQELLSALVLLAGSVVLATVALPPRESPLRMRLEPKSSHFATDEDVLVDVIYENTADVPIRVLQRTDLDGYPLRFDAKHNGWELHWRNPPVPAVPSLVGGSRAPEVDWEKDFVLLRPGAVLRRTFNLSREPATGRRRHDFSQPGRYELRATYESRWGLPTASSSQAVVCISGFSSPRS